MKSLSFCIMTFSTSLAICSDKYIWHMTKKVIVLLTVMRVNSKTAAQILSSANQTYPRSMPLRDYSCYISWSRSTRLPRLESLDVSPTCLGIARDLLEGILLYQRSQWSRDTKAWVCGNSFAGFVGSNPAGLMDVCLSWMLCVFR